MTVTVQPKTTLLNACYVNAMTL